MEDYSFGDEERQDQAFDVDEAMNDLDSDALDSETEGLGNEALGIDDEESDCKSTSPLAIHNIKH